MLTVNAISPSGAHQEYLTRVEPNVGRLVPTRSHYFDDPELYRRIFSMLAVSRDEAVVVIGVISAIRGEGRTTIASRLAMTLAADLEKQVTLVEADLEHPTLAQLFNVDAGPGLCAVLEGTQSLEAVAHPIARNLLLVPAGTATGSLAKLFGRLSTLNPFHQSSGLDGVVILDLPPILSNSYGALAAQVADVTVLVVRAGLSPIPVVREAMARMDTQPPRGIIFNDFGPSIPRWWPGRHS